MRRLAAALFVAASCVSPWCVSQGEAAPGVRPRSVILILSDDHRYDFMGFMGHTPFLRTPSMDRLAREGLHFQNAFVSTALCSPSRASILTGLYAHSHGIVDNNSPFPPGLTTFPRILQTAGYRTAFIGKWHMGHEGDEPRPGFDRWVSFRGQGEYENPTLNVDGQRLQHEGYTTDLLTDHALEWLTEVGDQPFFLFLSHKAVHALFEPAPRHRGAYDEAIPEYPRSMANTDANYEGKPAWVRAQRSSWHGVDFMYHGALQFDGFYRRYCETLLALDDSIGRVLDHLDRNGLGQETLVLYMGDNGFALGEHGLIDKRHMYEESMRVPMLARCPALVAPGTKAPQLVQNLDVGPTILDLAGLAYPKPVHGRSLLPLLRGEDVPWRDAVFYEYYWEANFPQTPTVHGMRDDRYKYIRYHGLWDRDELYDIQADPEEMTNLIDAPEHQDRVRAMNARLFDWLENTGGMQIPLRRDVGSRMDERGPGVPVGDRR